MHFNPDCPAELEKIINKLLEKDRRLRYQSAKDILVDLQRLRRSLISGPQARPAHAPERASIVVLPFENLSPDPEQEYFCDGMTEELIADLSHVQVLRVISRTSAMRLKGTAKDLQTIAAELKVRYVLEGSVRKAGNNLRITAQLTDAAGDEHLWADKYNGTLDDVFDMQEKVSRAIVGALRLKLTATEDRQIAKRPLPNAQAYDCYLRARSLTWRGNKEAIDEAVRTLEAGLRIVGENALLYAGLGYAYWEYVRFGVKQEEALAKAEEYARRAYGRSDGSSGAGYGDIPIGLLFPADSLFEACAAGGEASHTRVADR